jgi:hypothetical protein
MLSGAASDVTKGFAKAANKHMKGFLKAASNSIKKVCKKVCTSIAFGNPFGVVTRGFRKPFMTAL